MKDKVSDAFKAKDLATLCEANGYVMEKKYPQAMTHKVRLKK